MRRRQEETKRGPERRQEEAKGGTMRCGASHALPPCPLGIGPSEPCAAVRPRARPQTADESRFGSEGGSGEERKGLGRGVAGGRWARTVLGRRCSVKEDGENEGERGVRVGVWGCPRGRNSVLRVWSEPGRVEKLESSFSPRPGWGPFSAWVRQCWVGPSRDNKQQIVGWGGLRWESLYSTDLPNTS
jgi:hypothetical protein